MTEGKCQILLASVPYNGMVIERFCDLPATRYVNGWYCQHHAAVQPFPDPDASAVALAARASEAVPTVRDYGEPNQSPELDVVAMRVLKVHKDAVIDAMSTAAAVITAVGMDGFAASMAGAVLVADSSIARYVVGVRVPGHAPLIFGPYATRHAAETAIKNGHVPKPSHDSTAYAVPLTAAPRVAPKKAKKSKTDDAA